MWTAAILAGGQARRLGGRNKAALTLGGESILERRIAQLSRAADRTLIVAADPAAIERPHAAAPVEIIRDEFPGGGALGALCTALHAARTDRVIVMACDMPFVSDAFLAYLLRAGRDVDIAIPRTMRGYEPLCATYARRSAEGMQRLIEDTRFTLSEVVRIPSLTVREIGPRELVEFGPEERLFFNINTPDDYARAIDLDAEYRSLIG